MQNIFITGGKVTKRDIDSSVTGMIDFLISRIFEPG